MKNIVNEYIGLPYSTFVVPDVTTDNEPCYMAYHPELEGCMSHGNTPEEAIHNLEEVTELYISTLLEKGINIPLPQRLAVTWAVITPISEGQRDIDRVPSVTQPTFVPAV